MTKSSNTQVVEDCATLNISYLKNNGYFDGYNTGELNLNRIGEVNIETFINFKDSYITLSYQIHGKHLDQQINLTKTPCRFGGERFYFLCPSCDQKMAKLYLPPRKNIFGCRSCHNLIYKSQKERDKRIDALIKNPDLMVEKSKSPKKSDWFLVLKAVDKMHKNEIQKNYLAIKAMLNLTRVLEAF